MTTAATKDGSRGIYQNAFMLVTTLLQVILVGLMSWVLARVVNHGERLVGIESNRFTMNDAYTLQQELVRKIDELEIPPTWFHQEVKELKHDQGVIEDQVGEISRSLDRVLAILEQGSGS